MTFWKNSLDKMPAFRAICADINNSRTPVNLTGLSHIHKAHFIHALSEKDDSAFVLIAANEGEAIRLAEDLGALGRNVMFLPERELSLRSVESASREYEQLRLGVFAHMLEGSFDGIITTVGAVIQHTLPPELLRKSTFTITLGASLPVRDLAGALINSGYERADQIEGAGQFAIRGGIIDIFPASLDSPIRLELWGDTVDTLSYFDLISQRRTENLKEVKVPPAAEILTSGDGTEMLIKKISLLADTVKGKNADTVREKLFEDIEKLESGLRLASLDKYIPLLFKNPATIFDYIDEIQQISGMGVLTFVTEFSSVKESLKASNRQVEEDIKILLSEGELCAGLTKFTLSDEEFNSKIEEQKSVILDTFMRGQSDVRLKAGYNISAKQLPVWSGNIDVLVEDLDYYVSQRVGCVVLAGNEAKNGEILADDLKSRGIPAIYAVSPEKAVAGQVVVTLGGLSSGMEYPEIGLAIITHGRAYTVKKSRSSRHKKGVEIHSISELSPGDYVVHVSHGIGIFKGIEQIHMQGITKDYLKVEYQKGDSLYVPVTQLDLVSKYIGSKDDVRVKIHRLGGQEWQKAKTRVESAVKDIAKELISLYAKRMATPGFAFLPDGEWQYDFERRFNFDETEDQLRCIGEIKGDMEREVPMDRLLCGDVGFGKTEVALRAAFKCITSGKQCALLVPTTILAFQHYNTATARFEGFPTNIDMISRFRTPKQQAESIKQLKSGELDMIIGTHRLLSKDVEFKNLGLIIVDEEQRFGVAQKERLKEISPNVDVLTLTATPIPRTLNMAMSGVRDMSVIEEAPQDRRPVQTYVMEHDNGVVTEAMARELRRGGQVFYLHNRVESIERCAMRISERLPDARVSVAHGKMTEEQLSRIWRQMVDHEIDILVCTTIIETGVDIPNANTLIIENAENFGLSQLHQLRGRVGRSARRAYAYLTFVRGKALSEVATKRLEAMRAFTEFGAGFKIAMRDMEIRGAGDILGASQHGHMESVGYEMYLRLLNEAVDEQKGLKKETYEAECLVDIQVSAHIPESYISVNSQRLDVYRRIAEVRTFEDSLDVYDELIDRFGEPPEAVQGLIDIALLRNMAASLGIYEIKQTGNKLYLYLRKLDMEVGSRMSAKLKGRMMISAGTKPYFVVKTAGNGELNSLDTLREALEAALPPQGETAE